MVCTVCREATLVSETSCCALPSPLLKVSSGISATDYSGGEVSIDSGARIHLWSDTGISISTTEGSALVEFGLDYTNTSLITGISQALDFSQLTAPQIVDLCTVISNNCPGGGGQIIVSTDENNDITAGTDGGAYFNINNFATDVCALIAANCPSSGGNTSVVTPFLSAGLWRHDDGTGNVHDIYSTSTTPGNLLIVGPDGGSYLDPTSVLISETLTSLVLAGTDLTYTDEAGVPNIIDLSPAIEAGQTDLVVTTDGTALGVVQSGTSDHTVDITVLSTDAGNLIITGTDGGVVFDVTTPANVTAITQNIDLSQLTTAQLLQFEALVEDYETITTLVDNGDDTYTYTSEDGTTTILTAGGSDTNYANTDLTSSSARSHTFNESVTETFSSLYSKTTLVGTKSRMFMDSSSALLEQTTKQSSVSATNAGIFLKTGIDPANQNIFMLTDAYADFDFATNAELRLSADAGVVGQAICSNGIGASPTWNGINWSTTEQVDPFERHDGETVYYKYVDFGAGPNTTLKSLAHSIANLDVILESYVVSINTGTVRRVVTFSQDDRLDVDGTNLNWTSVFDRSTWESNRWYLKYTKTA